MRKGKMQKGVKIKTLPQEGIIIPHVGEVVYYPGEYPGLQDITEGYHLSFLKLDELRVLLPQRVHIPTLKEDFLIKAYASSFGKVELYVEEFDGPVSFYGKEVSPGRYKRAHFKMKPSRDGSCYVDLNPLLGEDHYVDTQLKDLEIASKADFDGALEEQGLNPAEYPFDEGVMATILERGQEVDRTYIASGLHTLVLQRKYGTPLVTVSGVPFKNYPVDLKASGFPEDLLDTSLELVNAYLIDHDSLTHFRIDRYGNRGTLDFFMNGERMVSSFEFPPWAKYPEENGIIPNPTGLYMLRAK